MWCLLLKVFRYVRAWEIVIIGRETGFVVWDLSLLVQLFLAILVENQQDRLSLRWKSEEDIAFPVPVLHNDLLCYLFAGAPANSAIIWHVQQVRGQSKIDL